MGSLVGYGEEDVTIDSTVERTDVDSGDAVSVGNVLERSNPAAEGGVNYPTLPYPKRLRLRATA